MARAVLISIHPEWVNRIISGEKNVEIRKTRPNLGTPFKCYIYETQGKSDTPWIDEDGHMIFRKMPPEDAVPVVRCRDCIHHYTDEYGFLACAESGAMLSPEEDDYCSRGQRRDQSADVRNMEEGNEHE